MIRNAEEFSIARERLQELEGRVEQIVSNRQKSRRAKEMELAGVRSMIMQIQREIREYQLSRIQQSIHAIQGELESEETAVNLPAVVFKTLSVLEDIAQVLEPAGNFTPQLDGSEM